MTTRRRVSRATSFGESVFINCPFDVDYLPIFRALVFAILECGFEPRCAQEVYDAGEVRLEKIVRIIRQCRLGVHDISRTELNKNGLPRFNMPLELGLFIGACRFGSGDRKRKSCLVLDTKPYRYQEFLSDIAGQDIASHAGEAGRAITAVREWLVTGKASRRTLPGGSAIAARYARFVGELPTICADVELEVEELTFVEFVDMAAFWLSREMRPAKKA